MDWVPGWQSPTSAEWWSSLYFWVGIVFLVLLTGSEVASHLYSLRRAELGAIAERRAATARDTQHQQQADAYRAELRAAEARAAAAQAEIEKLRAAAAPRVLTAEQHAAIVAAAQPFAGEKFRMAYLVGNSEARRFGMEIVSSLEAAGWDHDGPEGIVQAVPNGPTAPVDIRLSPIDVRDRTFPTGLVAIVQVLERIGLLGKAEVIADDVVPRGYIQVQIGEKTSHNGQDEKTSGGGQQ
ncbi:MAG TPA: hypothetical protein VMB34_08820 [Acetobacteraceae bacterium]|nr:hypothetical protein [Acetobacteraceae bacterium]